MKRIIVSIVAFALAAGWAVGQETSAWAEVEYYVGHDIVVIRDGRSLPFEDVLGMRLLEGDQIQTGKRTFVEVRLLPSGNLLKLSENTAFVLKSLSSPSASDLKLLYGRIRAKVSKIASADSFNIASDSAVAGVRGTDFGYDVLVPKARGSEAQKPLARIYCFDGSVLVTVTQPDASEAKEVLVTSGDMALIRQEAGIWVPEVTPILEEIQTFWKKNDFTAPAEAAKLSGHPSPAATTDASSGVLTLPSYARVQAGLKVKNAAIFGGIVLVGMGSVLQGLGAYAYASGDPMLGLNAVAGGAFMGILSLPVLVFGLTKNPVLAEP